MIFFLGILMNLTSMDYQARTAGSGDTQMSNFTVSQVCTNDPKKFQAVLQGSCEKN